MRVALCFSAALVFGCSSLIGLDEFKPDLSAAGAGGVGGDSGSATGAGNSGSGGLAGTGADGTGGAGNIGGTGNTGGGGSGGTEGTTGCPTNLKGPSMSRMTLGGDDFFCVDTTEVTNAQYEEFVTFGSLAGQPSGCGFNSTYSPTGGSACAVLGYDPGNKPTYPVTCIDWCDAYMFCEWAGKRLCGAISGGAVAAGDRANASIDQWYNACTLNGSRSFPYGNTFASGRCNDLISPSAGPFICGGFPNCSGNYPGQPAIYDMSCNVAEWEDSCTRNSCAARGGDWLAYNDTAACAQVMTADRDVRDDNIGFRCCWDPPN